MQRYQLEHAIRAASGITGEEEFIVIGSGALLGTFPDAPAELTGSTEVDLYPRDNPAKAEDLHAIGELSLFHQTHGFWIDPVGPETATLPRDWESRLVRVSNANTNQAVGWCLEIHDLAISKLVAGREKDLTFVMGLVQHGLVRADVLRERLRIVELSADRAALATGRLERCLLS